MNDDRFDQLLREASREYNAPPATPTESMWAEIQRQRGAKTQRARAAWRRPWVLAPLAAAAVLILGISIGRWTALETTTPDFVAPQIADAPAQTPENGYFRAAAGRHLQQTETLLTLFALDGPNAGDQARVEQWARKLLVDTRLLLDSPAAEDPALHQLLTDLELYLARIVQLSSGRPGNERERINDDLRDRGVLLRLRSQLPAGHV